MNKTYEKYETLITLGIIFIYILSNSYCLNNFGITSFKTLIVNFVLTILIVLFAKKNKLVETFGLTHIPKLKSYLYFIPLVILISVNLWTGININNTASEIIWYMLSMLLVGFLEEIIFRGFLFNMMAKDNLKLAVIVTSLTFGIGHIINLLNGAELIPTLVQICYAAAVGYLFAIIVIKSKSLWPCIITHSLTNALSIFNIENAVSIYVAPIAIILISVTYAIYLNTKIKEQK